MMKHYCRIVVTAGLGISSFLCLSTVSALAPLLPVLDVVIRHSRQRREEQQQLRLTGTKSVRSGVTFLLNANDDDAWEDDDDFEEEEHELHWLDTDAEDIYYEYDDSDDYDDEDEEEGQKTLGESIGQGEVVMCLPDVASASECQTLFAAGLEASKQANAAVSRGRSRMSVSDPNCFSNDIVLLCDDILLRVIDYLDDYVPSVYTKLFQPHDQWLQQQPLNAYLEQPTVPPEAYLADTCDCIRDLYMMGELEWSEGEPAINVYEDNGYFGAHKDHLALTVLIPLTAPDSDFTGGGTGFWAGNRNVDENPNTGPDLVLKPTAGSALIFGGDVTHAGLPVESGYRSVLVCSFSTRTPASSPDRLHGLRAPPQVSPSFKGG